MKKNKNNVTMIGQLEKELEFDYESYGERFYSSKIICQRKSGTEDVIPITVSELLFDKEKQYVGKTVKILGSFRSCNREGHLLLSIFADDFSTLDGEYETKSNNVINLDGYICKPPAYRLTPLGRQITDMMIAVNRPTFKSDYIPCVVWGRNAVYASGLHLGDNIAVSGRIQSREYRKHMEDGTFETRTAYEVSVRNLALIERKEDKNE